jgi:cell division protein FtsN
VLFGTGDGQETEAAIALDALPEDPLPRPGTAEALPAVDEALEAETRAPDQVTPRLPPRQARPADVVTPTEPPRTPVAPTPSATPAPQPVAAGAGTTVQLGAYSSQARARAAFKSLTERYAYLQGMEPMILAVSSDGKTLYRLRSVVGSPAQAKDICGRLRVAGEACSVVD